MSSCAPHRRQAGSFCQERVFAQTLANTVGFHTPAMQRRSSDHPCTSELRRNARGVGVARWYDPTTAEFTTIDPDVASTGQPYTYAGDDPVNEWDPDGLRPWWENALLGVVGVAAVDAWDNGTIATVGNCLGTQCYDTHQGAVDVGDGALNAIASLNPNPSQRVTIPAEYPCMPGAYQIGEGLTYGATFAAGGLVPGADEAEEAEIAAEAAEGELVPSGQAFDTQAQALANRIGGQAQVEFASGPNAGREFDPISRQYVAQAKPANFGLSQAFRIQAKATFQAAIDTGRIPYFQFDGPPQPGVIQALQRYAQRYGVQPVIDTQPLP